MGGFTVGTNLDAWLYSIMRNYFLTQRRNKVRRALLMKDRSAELCPPDLSDQFNTVWSKQVLSEMNNLSPALREAVVLAAAGATHEEIIQQTDAKAIGTAKSRVCRGRAALAGRLGGDTI
jgi:RNA polymerase sigma-70 factor (ECF subfamily)